MASSGPTGRALTLDLLYVYRDLGATAGGLAVDVRNLANEMARRGHNVTVATLRRSGRPAGFDDAVELVAGVPAALRAAKRHAITHVFSTLPSALHWGALGVARRSVWTPMFHPARIRLWRGYGLYFPMEAFDRIAPRAACFVDAVAVATEAERRHFAALGARRVVMLPPAVELAPPVAAADDVRPGRVVLTVLQRDERRKGLAFGIEAFQRLRESHRDARLLVVGLTGADGEGVEFLGRVTEKRLRALLRRADVVWVPARYEAFSRVVIEAWEQETPVVVTSGVALALEVAEVGGAVVRFGEAAAAANALAETLGRPEQGRAGRRLVAERFVLPLLADRAESLYFELVK